MSETKKKSNPLENYVEVHERIAKFYEKHPEGSLQGDYTIQEVGGQLFVVYKARAFRTPDDRRPGIGMAWEPFPGRTPFTKDSELMVGETSAWGRAIASLGFEVHRGIASAAEVRNRTGEGDGPPITPNQKRKITIECNAKAVTDDEKRKLLEWVGGEPLTVAKASKLIDLLVNAPDHAAVLKGAGIEPEGSFNDLPEPAFDGPGPEPEGGDGTIGGEDLPADDEPALL